MEISVQALSLMIAGVGVLLAWLGYSSNKRQKEEVKAVEQAKVDTEQRGDLHAITESLKQAWDRIHSLDEDIGVLVQRIGELDKVSALNNKDIAQLTKEMDRLVEMHSQLYKLMADLFKRKEMREELK